MSCYLKDGRLVCEVRPSGGPPPQDDRVGESALATSARPGAPPALGGDDDDDDRGGRALGFPEPPRLGFLMQGLERPSPERGRRWEADGAANQLLLSRNLGARPPRASGGAVERQLAPQPRVLPPVPTVAALMYDN